MKQEEMKKIKDVFRSYASIKLAYFFGSQVTGEAGPMSDFDFAFFADGIDKKQAFDLKLKLMDEIGLILKTEKIDVVCLNFVESPELKYAVIKDGELILQQEPYKILVEPQIMNEYFDFNSLLKKYNLTKT